MRKLLFIPLALAAIGGAQAQPAEPPAASPAPAEHQAAKELIERIHGHLERKYPENTSVYNAVSERLLLCGAVYTALADRSSVKDSANRARLHLAGRALGSASRVLFQGSDDEYSAVADRVLGPDLKTIMGDKPRAAGLLKNCQGLTNPATLEDAVVELTSDG